MSDMVPEQWRFYAANASGAAAGRFRKPPEVPAVKGNAVAMTILRRVCTITNPRPFSPRSKEMRARGFLIVESALIRQGSSLKQKLE